MDDPPLAWLCVFEEVSGEGAVAGGIDSECGDKVVETEGGGGDFDATKDACVVEEDLFICLRPRRRGEGVCEGGVARGPGDGREAEGICDGF